MRIATQTSFSPSVVAPSIVVPSAPISATGGAEAGAKAASEAASDAAALKAASDAGALMAEASRSAALPDGGAAKRHSSFGTPRSAQALCFSSVGTADSPPNRESTSPPKGAVHVARRRVEGVHAVPKSLRRGATTHLSRGKRVSASQLWMWHFHPPFELRRFSVTSESRVECACSDGPPVERWWQQVGLRRGEHDRAALPCEFLQ